MVTVIFYLFCQKNVNHIHVFFFFLVLFIPLQIFLRKRSSLQNVTGQIMLLAIRVVYDKLLLFNYDNYLL